MVVGGYTQQNEADHGEFKEVADFAVDELNRRSNAMYPLELKQIKNVETQVVAGTNYRLTLSVGGGPQNNAHDVTVVVFEGLDGNKEFVKHE
ncbi:hypothetical protein AKO1_007750 [Acrasis kona]|uniref:Cystatin domain-containing protein n=1 Tax=Acrasis kona TaxID=1008807 RepID=A0AAW2YTR4_9EUKA